MRRRGSWAACLLLVLAAGALSVAQSLELVKTSRTLFVNDQQTFVPGYPVGNIAIGDPRVADFKVMPGRRELLLFGKGRGTTTLAIWDQQNVKRHEIELSVTTREDAQAEHDLRDLLKEFPSVDVRRVLGKLAITGTVERKQDFDAIQRFASAARAENLVILRPPAGSSQFPTPTSGPGAGAASPPAAPVAAPPAAPAVPPPAPPAATTQPATPPSAAPATGGSGAPAASGSVAPAPALTAPVVQVEYVVDLLEASVAFASGSYDSGIEPSGRSLFKQTVRVAVDAEGEVYMSGAAVVPKDAAKGGRRAAYGIRLKLKPTLPGPSGAFTTLVLVETNVPVQGAVEDPLVWRRARWEMAAEVGVPFGLGGAELLAMPQVAARGTSKIGIARGIASAASGLGLPGGSTTYTGMSAVPTYDRSKKTQLLVVFHPRLVPPVQ